MNVNKELAFAAMGVNGGDPTGKQYEKKQDELQKLKPSGDWNAAEGEPGHVLNRPFYSEFKTESQPLLIEWDGNTDGKKIVSSTVAMNTAKLYKVSDIVLTDDEIRGCVYTYNNLIGNSSEAMADNWDAMVASGYVTNDYVAYAGVGMMGISIKFIVCRKTGVIFEGYTFDEPGVYALPAFRSLSNPEAMVDVVTETVHKMDEKYLPEVGDTVVINVVPDGDGYCLKDYTFGQLLEMYKRGIHVMILYNGKIFQLSAVDTMYWMHFTFSGFHIFENALDDKTYAIFTEIGIHDSFGEATVNVIETTAELTLQVVE